MKPECGELEVLVSLRATGAELSAADGARLDRHLEGCPECRAELSRSEELLDLVRLPAVTPAEARALDELPSRALAELRRRDRRSGIVRRVSAVAGGLALAAALAGALLAPAVMRSRSPVSPAPAPVATQVASWQEPDVDSLWTESAVLDESSSDDSSLADAALSALDAAADI